MKRLWLFVVILLASCMSTQDTPNVSLETLAQAQDAWVQKYFEPGSQVVRGAVQKDGSYMVTVTTEKGSVDTKLSNLPNFSSSQPRLSASNASSMALWALKGKRARALGATRAGLRPLDHLDWVSQYGVRNGQWHFTSVQMKTENKCYGIFNCGIESVQFKGTIGRSGVVAAWDRRDWNTAVGVWVSQKFADGVVVINGHNDLLFATSDLKGALSTTARYKPTFLVSATQAGRQTSISRLMRGTRFFNLTAQRSYNFCSTSNAATDVGGGGPVCAPKPTKVSNGGCVSCAQYSGLIQQSQSALLDIENNQFVDRDGKLLEATGALTINHLRNNFLSEPRCWSLTFAQFCFLPSQAVELSEVMKARNG